MQYIDLAFAKAIDHRKEVVTFLSLLMSHARAGHLCTSIEENRILPDCPAEFLEEALAGEKIFTPEKNGPIVKEGNHYYLARNYFFEKRMEESLKKLLNREAQPLVPKNLPSMLTDEQQEAIHKGLRSPFLLLTGGPGRGKTFTASHLLANFLEQTEGRVLLTAPTGKATLRLTESIAKNEKRLQSGTLHSLLKIRGPKDFYKEPPRLEADLIIVDEASMIDARLFSLFLQAVPDHARLIIMGDGDQLPPVEAGDLFTQITHLIKAQYPQNYCELTKCMRSDRIDLLTLADHVRHGEVDKALKKISLQPLPSDLSPQLPNFPQPTKNRPNPEQLLQQLQEFRILTPLREGRYGVTGISKKFFELLAHQMEPPYYFAYPILITKNSYDQELYNGEAGIIIRKIDNRNTPLQPKDIAYFPNGREIPALLLPPHEISYALSIHKSQGSEFGEVYLLLPPGSERFSREILYTGITRAKTKLTLCGDRETFSNLLSTSGKRSSNISFT